MKFLSKIKVDAKEENFDLIRSQIRSCLIGHDNLSETTKSTIGDIMVATHEAFCNACKFAYKNKKGFVTICLGVNNQKNKFYIIVSDKGVGIKDIKQAVQPFYTTSDESSGMGFTIMQSFMDNLKVESNIGEGTSIKMSKSL